jgi:hypothetical protein
MERRRGKHLEGAMKRVLGALCTLAVAVAFGAAPVWADDEPSTGMNGKVLIVKGGKMAKFISKWDGVNLFDLPNTPANDPTIEGGSIQFSEIGGDIHLSAALPVQASPLGWKGLGNPAGSKGFKYKGAGTPTDPCKVVLVKEKIVKAVCKASNINFDQPVTGDVAILLTIGTSSKNYCTTFGGSTVKNDTILLKRKDNLTTAGPCTCGTNPATVTFKNGPPTTANCGTLTDKDGNGMNMACNGLYIGSGSGTLSLPETVPDSNKALVMDVECCTGENLILTPTSSTDTGDIETCTKAGCKFGAPLPLPNPNSTVTSTCVFNTYQTDVTGEANCSTGAARLRAPLNSSTYLTGDVLPSRCVGGTNPGARCGTFLTGTFICLGGGVCTPDNAANQIQPCPICNATTGRCNGGANGMGTPMGGTVDADSPCTPDGGQNVAGVQFPTSHDCTIAASQFVGTIPVPFLLTTGTSTDTAVPSGTQQRVFCGFCRDRNGTLTGFGTCGGPSPNNGMACVIKADCPGGTCTAQPCESDADCAEPLERCEQRNEGAFGPGGGANKTITLVGTPGGDLNDFLPHDATLVSAFCIPPLFDSIIDPAADLPGPGAVSLPGKIDITTSPSGAFLDGSNPF